MENCIAVEATYLNEVYFDGAERIDVDKVTHSITQSLANVIHRVKITERLGSIYVSARISPKLNVRHIRSSLTQLLEKVEFSPSVSDSVFTVDPYLSISLLWTPTVHETPFRLGSVSVKSPGGFVIQDILDGVTRIMSEKREKLNKVGQFSYNWLCVGSALTIGLDEHEVSVLAELIPRDGFWNKIVLLDYYKIESSPSIDLQRANS